MAENVRYPIRLYFDDDGKVAYWVAEFVDLEGCIGVGDTKEEALEDAEANKERWLEAAREIGKAIPPPSTVYSAKYSGRFNLRISKELHRQLAIRAEHEGTSLNALCANLLAAQLAAAAPGARSARKPRKSSTPSKRHRPSADTLQNL